MSKGKGGVPVDEKTGRVLETAQARADGLAEIRARMEKSVSEGKITKFLRTDDQFLLPFLRARKYKIDSAFEVLCNFNKFFYKYAHLMEGLCAARCRRFNDAHMIKFMNGKDVDGNSVYALFMGALNPDKFNAEDQVLYAVYTMALLFERDDLQLNGITYVETLEGFSMGKVLSMGKFMDTKEHKELMNLPTDTFPMRIRGIFLIDQPWYFNFFWSIVKPFFKKKITKRIRLFGKKYDELFAVVPKDVLPPEFGGTNTISFDWLLDTLEEREKSGGGMIGGFRFPLSVADPTGERFKQQQQQQVQNLGQPPVVTSTLYDTA